MKDGSIYITEFDLKRMENLGIGDHLAFSAKGDVYEKLEEDFERAEIVAPEEVPGNVITMNSKVQLLDIDTGEEMTCILVFPGDADISENKISILSPIGSEILGYRVGDVVEIDVIAGLKRLKIMDLIYQPERSGDFDL